MTWPEVFYKIIIDGGGTLLSAIVVLALFTDFWPLVFRRDGVVWERTKYIEIVPEAVQLELVHLAEEMRRYVSAGEPIRPITIVFWAVRLERLLPDEDEDDEEGE